MSSLIFLMEQALGCISVVYKEWKQVDVESRVAVYAPKTAVIRISSIRICLRDNVRNWVDEREMRGRARTNDCNYLIYL